MYTCDQCSEQLLDYLYELLDDADAQHLQQHLQDCAVCRSSLDSAREQQQLLARAACVYKEVPEFASPAATTTTSNAVETGMMESVPTPKKTAVTPSYRLSWRWGSLLATAAALLLAIGWGYTQYQSGLREREELYRSAKLRITEVDRQAETLIEEYKKAQVEVPVQLQQKQLRLSVSGAAQYNPKAPAVLNIETRDLTGSPTAAEVEVRVSKGGLELWSQKNSSRGGAITMPIPAGLEDHPGKTMQLDINAKNSWTSANASQLITVSQPNYLTHLATNKSIYQSGETLFFRGLTLDSYSFQPASPGLSFRCELQDSNGKVHFAETAKNVSGGIVAGEISLPASLKDGEYLLAISPADNAKQPIQMATATQKVQIRNQESMELVLNQNAYRVTDKLIGEVRTRSRRGNAEAPAKQSVTVRLVTPEAVNGATRQVTKEFRTQTDRDGNARFSFDLPKKMIGNNAKLEIVEAETKSAEKIVQQVPVLSSDWQAEVLPEGGVLVPRVTNRIYCSVTPPAKTKSPVTLEIVDGDGKVLTSGIPTQAMLGSVLPQLTGVTEVIPSAQQKLRMQVRYGQKIVVSKPLPPLMVTGMALMAENAVATEDTPIVLQIASPQSETCVAVASCRGLVVATQRLETSAKGKKIYLYPLPGTRGVIRVTLYRPELTELTPVAERLIYRIPKQQMVLSCTIDQDKGNPQDSYQLGIQAQTEGKAPINGWSLAAVVDRSLASNTLAEMPASFLVPQLTKDIHQLENLQIPLADNAGTKEHMDRFLAIYGWRRFVDLRSETLIARPIMNQTEPVKDAEIFFQDTLFQAKQRYEKEKQRELTVAWPNLQPLGDMRVLRVQEASSAWQDLEEYRMMPYLYLRVGMAIAIIVLFGASLILLIMGIWRALRSHARATLTLGAASAALLMCLSVYLATSSFRTTEDKGTAMTDLQKLLIHSIPELPEPPDLPLPGEDLKNLRSTGNVVYAQLRSKTETSTQKPEVADGALAKKDDANRLKLASANLNFQKQIEQQNALFQNATRLAELDRQQSGKAESAGGISKGNGPTDAKSPQPNLPAAPGGFAGGGRGGAMPPGAGSATSDRLLREYAFQRTWMPPQKIYSPDTLLWQPALPITNGKGRSLSFQTPGNLQNYQIYLLGNDANGRLGSYVSPLLHRDGQLEPRPDNPRSEPGPDNN